MWPPEPPRRRLERAFTPNSPLQADQEPHDGSQRGLRLPGVQDPRGGAWGAAPGAVGALDGAAEGSGGA